MVNVLIVDDQEMVRVGLRAILDAQDAIEVVGDVGDGFQGIDFLETAHVDVILMDVRMPGIDGIETTRRIRERHSPQEVRVVVLTTFDKDEDVIAALRAGANGFLSKGIGPSELAAGIHEVADGGGALSAAATAALIDHVVTEEPRPTVDAEAAGLSATLTPRERDIVVAIATGLDNAQIAEHLFVSPFTVKTHANRAMMKVGARDRAQLVTFAYRAGLAQ